MLSSIAQFLTINPPTTVLQNANQPALNQSLDAVQQLEESDDQQHDNLKKAKLVMVTAHNNNKFYEMTENADGTFTVNYGRVGSRSASCTYPMTLWDRKRKEKIRKGYTDTTYLFTHQKNVSDFLKIKNTTVQMLIDELMRFARQSIFANYHVSSDQVSMQQIKEAQRLIDQLSSQIKRTMDVKVFNNDLMSLYAVIPRKMNKVQEHLIECPKSQKDIEDIENKLAEEQATLDVMRGQVEIHEKKHTQQEAPKTLLETFGLQIELLEEERLIKNIKKMMGTQADRFHRAYKVINIRTQQNFEEHLKKSSNSKTALFWHGSRNENWLSILETGLVLRPANAIINGKMFGYGLYFADKFSKSLNYSSLRGSYWASGSQNKGFLALYDVHIGKQLKVKKHENWCSSMSQEGLKRNGKQYDSLFAKGGVDLINNEYIVYNQQQCTVRYLVEVC